MTQQQQHSDDDPGPFNIVTSTASPVPDEDFEAPDFSLGRFAFPIQLKTHVTYIVAGVVIKKEDNVYKVLLVQEAKPSCRGKWYLPAGRMERGESIERATKREMREEAGYEVECESLIYTECQGSGWYRFTSFCEITGGDLKTEADSESLRAEFVPVDIVLNNTKDCSHPLRSKDVQRLVKAGVGHYQATSPRPCSPSAKSIDAIVPGMFIRLFVIHCSNSKYSILLSRDSVAGTHDLTVPIVEFSLSATSFPAVVSKFYRELMEHGTSTLAIPTTVLAVQCSTARFDINAMHPEMLAHDGLCVSLLAVVKPHNPQPVLLRPERYVWQPLHSPDQHDYLKFMLDHGPVFHML